LNSKLDYIKALSIIALATSIAFFANKRNQAKKIVSTNISFSNKSKFVSKKDVENVLAKRAKDTAKGNFTKLDLYNAEESLALHSMISDASLFVTIDGQLNAIIEQRKPIARVMQRKGGYYIDEKANVMPLSKNYSERVLLITGSVEKKHHDELYELANLIKNDSFLKKQIVEINRDRKGVFTLKTRLTNQEIILGNSTNMKSKLDNYKVLYTKMSNEKIIGKYKSFNLAFNSQVVCTKA